MSRARDDDSIMMGRIRPPGQRAGSGSIMDAQPLADRRDELKRTMTLQMPISTYDELRDFCAARHLKIGATVTEAVKLYMRENG